MPAYPKLAVAGLCLVAGSQVAVAADPAPALLNPTPASATERADFEPAMHVTPNAVALKE